MFGNYLYNWLPATFCENLNPIGPLVPLQQINMSIFGTNKIPIIKNALYSKLLFWNYNTLSKKNGVFVKLMWPI